MDVPVEWKEQSEKRKAKKQDTKGREIPAGVKSQRFAARVSSFVCQLRGIRRKLLFFFLISNIRLCYTFPHEVSLWKIHFSRSQIEDTLHNIQRNKNQCWCVADSKTPGVELTPPASRSHTTRLFSHAAFVSHVVSSEMIESCRSLRKVVFL